MGLNCKLTVCNQHFHVVLPRNYKETTVTPTGATSCLV